MASVGIAPNPGARDSTTHAIGVDKLPEEMNDMKIRDDKVCFDALYYSFWYVFKKSKMGCDCQEMEATVVDGNGTETGHIIVTTIGGRNGQPKQVFASSDICKNCSL